MIEKEGLRGLRAFAHPLRLRVLSLLTSRAMSAAEVARAFGETQANMSYHLRVLRDAGLLEVAEETSVRGGRAVRYRHDAVTGDRRRAAAPEEHLLLAAALIEELRRRTALRLVGDDVRGLDADAELWVTPQDWETFRGALQELSLTLHAAARPAGTSGTVRTSMTISAFRMREKT